MPCGASACGASLPFTTSFHTRFPDYLADRLPVPERWTSEVTWAWLRRFHAPGAAVLAATPTLASELATRGFKNVKLWPRGVDAELFRPRASVNLNLPRPIFLTVGRLAVEKNLEAFLALDLPGTKLVVGDGPARDHAWRGNFRTRCLSGRGTARRWPKSTPPPTSLCFQAAPTRSGSCCWRRWRAACRLLRFPPRRHAT